ncbi:MAG TPA: hypothetical protein VMC05_03310 [Xanthobacteraceae bacterium]|nr:hypothetical protein [Xanthobacteraceae bacterium]
MLHRKVWVVAVLASIAPVALAMSGCSPVSYPSIFPAVEEAPPPRADTPMNANQVQQATEDLITDRNRLSAEAQGSPGAAAAAAATKPAGGAQNAGATAGMTQTAGTETK